MNGAQSLIRTLVNAGVDVCFMNPGTSEMHFVAALDRIEEQGGDRWTRTHQRLWAALMKQGNPSLDIPRVEDIAK